MNTDAGVANRQGIVSAARRAQQVAQLAGSEGGQAALLRAQYGQQGLTQGGLGLDQMLLSSSGTDLSDLRRLGSQATRSVEDLMTQESTTQQGLSQELAAVKGEALGGLETEIGQKLSGVEQQRTGINQALASVKQKLNQPGASVQEILSRLNPQERQIFQQYSGEGLQLLGTDAEMQEQLRGMAGSIGQISEQDQLKLMSPEQRARAEVLARLSQRGALAEQVTNIGDQQVQGLVGQTDTTAARNRATDSLTALNQQLQQVNAPNAEIEARTQQLRQEQQSIQGELDALRNSRISGGTTAPQVQQNLMAGGFITPQQQAARMAQLEKELEKKLQDVSGRLQGFVTSNQQAQKQQAEAIQNQIKRQQSLLDNNFDILDFLRR
jgi:hypothetical protein